MAGLRILTSNLLVDRASPEAIAALIDRFEPDVMAVQELGTRTAEAVSDSLPHGKLDPRDDGFGLGIAARRPVEVESVDLDARPGWAARLDGDEWGLPQPFTVVNVHLTNPISWPWHRSLAARRAQVERIEQFTAGVGGPYVVVGDMNSTPAWPAYRRLAKLGDDAARTTGTAQATWNHFLRGPRLIRIDHAFVSGARPVTTQTVLVHGSDHRALVIDIDL